MVGDEQVHVRSPIDAGIVLPSLAAYRSSQVLDQERNVLAPLPERRHRDREHVQPVEEIAAERPSAIASVAGRGWWRR